MRAIYCALSIHTNQVIALNVKELLAPFFFHVLVYLCQSLILGTAVFWITNF